MIRSLSVVAILLFSSAMGALGQEAPVVILTLDEALELAMENSQVQVLRAGAQAQESHAQSEENRWMGELMLNGGVALNGDDTLIRPITSEMLASGVANMPFDDRYAFWSLAYRVPLFTGGIVSGNRNAARLTAEASRRNMSRAVLGIRHQVLKTYVDLLSIDAGIDAWQDELKALDSLVGHIEMGMEVGKYSRVDLLKAKVQHQSVVAKWQSLQMQRVTDYATLLFFLGQKPGTGSRYELVPVHLDHHAFPMMEVMVDSAMARRSDLKALRDLAAAQRFNAGAVGGGRWPQVSVGGNFSGAHGGSIDFDDTFWSVNATVSLPLLDMGRRNNLSKKAELNAHSAQLRVVDLEGRIRAEVMAGQAAYANSLSNIEIQQSTLELASEISRLEKLRYDSGRGDIDNLLKSLSSQRVAEAALTNARNNQLIAWNHLQLTIEGECR